MTNTLVITCNMCKHYKQTGNWVWIEDLDSSFEINWVECTKEMQPDVVDTPKNPESYNLQAETEKFLAFASQCPGFEQG